MDTTNNNPTLTMLLKSTPEVAQRIQTIFNYHYDAIIREVTQEISPLPQDLREYILAYLADDMEDSWPYSEEELIKSIKL